jgi:uncharacterized protein with GYD domain
MPLFIVTGCYTQQAAKGMLESPSDREAAAAAIMKAAGGTQKAFYITTGDTDWMSIAEFDDGKDLLPVGLVTASSGAVSNIKTMRAYTAAEFRGPRKKRRRSHPPTSPQQNEQTYPALSGGERNNRQNRSLGRP